MSETAINPDRDSAIAFYNEGTLLAKREKYNEAVRLFDKALAIDPEYVKALENKALALQKLGRLKKAEISLLEIVKIEPESAIIWQKIGILRSYMDDYKGALEAFEKVIDFGYADAGIYSNRGVILERLGRIDEAIASIKQAIEMKHTYTNAHYNLASVYAHNGMVSQCIKTLSKLKELMSKNTLLGRISKDSDFDPIRDNPQFRNYLKSLE